MKKILLIFGCVLMINCTNYAQDILQYRICPEAIAFPVMSGCSINALQESDCVRMGSTVYSSSNQSLATYNGSSWILSNGQPLSSTTPSISNVQSLTLGNQTLDNTSAFGYVAAISDKYAVVSAPNIQFQTGFTGAVYVFKKNSSGNWLQVAVIQNDATGNYYSTATLQFGRSVDVSGNNIIVGSHPRNTLSGTGGAVHFFSIDPITNAVTFQNTFTSQNAGSDFGFGVKISGDYAIAPERALTNYVCSGASPNQYLRIYKKSGNNWIADTPILVGKDIMGANIEGDLIALTRTTSACLVNLNTYKLIANVWTASTVYPNLGFTPSYGSIYRCGANVSLLYTREAGASGGTFGNHFKLNMNTSAITLARNYNDYIYSGGSIPPFPRGPSVTYEGIDMIGYEISGGASAQNGYIRLVNNQVSSFAGLGQYAMPSNLSIRSAVIDAAAGNFIYCSNPSLSGNTDDYRVIIGKLF